METDARFLRQLSQKATSYLFFPGQYLALPGTIVKYAPAFQTLIPNHLGFRWLHLLRRRHGPGDVLCQEGSGSGHWRWWHHCGRHLGSRDSLWRGENWFLRFVTFIYVRLQFLYNYNYKLIWLVESIQSIHDSLWTWHDKCNICYRYCIYHVKVCLVTNPLGVFSSETKWLNASRLFLRMNYVKNV